MPTYQYLCTECGGQLEAVQKFTDEPLTVHEDCGGRLRKVFSPVGIVFKGSGFYRTDSRASAVVWRLVLASSKENGSKESGSKESGSKEKSGSSSSSDSASSSSKSGGDSSSSSSSAGAGSASSSSGGSSGEKVA